MVHVTKPCPECGGTDSIRDTSTSICRRCKNLIAFARQRKADDAKINGDEVLVFTRERGYALPGYYPKVGSRAPHEVHDRLIGNRICAQFKAKLGQAPGTSEDELDDDSVKILDQLRTEFKKITDGVKHVKLATFKSSPLISDYTEFCLLQQYLELEESEERHLKNVEKMLVEYPIWNEFLSKIPGCGPKMGGIIISEIDIKIAKYPSSLWQYAGLGVEPDGAGTSRRKEHLKVIPYTDKDGNPATRVSIRFNPFLKTKLIGVLGPCMLKSGTKKVKVDDKTKILDLENSSSYVKIYLNYKNRLENHSKYGIAFDDTIKGNKAHRHNMAIRYMIKRFLVDLYNVWRKLENLPVAPEYGEAKLGHIHGAGPSFSAQG